MSKPTAWRALHTLQANGLATQIAGTWHRLDADLDALAASLGTAGARKRQAAQHERERESWRELCRLRLQNAARQPMPEAELVNPARILAGRQTQAENRRKVETPPPLATQIATSTSTPPPLAAASTATETATGAPTETPATATQTPTPAHVAGIVHELAGAMRWDKRWPEPKQRTAAELEERRRTLQAQAAELLAHEHTAALQARRQATPLKVWTDATEAEHAETFREALAIIAHLEHEQAAVYA